MMGTGPEGEVWLAVASEAPYIALLRLEGEGERSITLASDVCILWLDWLSQRTI